MPSSAFSSYSFMGALAAIGEKTQQRVDMDAPAQGRAIMEAVAPIAPDIERTGELFTAEELATIATSDVRELDQFFRERGFSIPLPSRLPGGLGLGAVLDILAKWAVPGRPIEPGNVCAYPQVYMKVDEKGFAVLPGSGIFERKPEGNASDVNYNPIVAIFSIGGDVVLLGMVEQPPSPDKLVEAGVALANHFSLFERGGISDKAMRGMIWPDGGPGFAPGKGSLYFPMVDMEVERQFPEIRGMVLSSGSIRMPVEYAVQVNRLRMNEKGARAQSASAMTFRAAAMGRAVNIYIDQGFLFTIYRPGTIQPVFTAWVDPKDWKKPTSIETLQ